jgi:hypothetical protein
MLYTNIFTYSFYPLFVLSQICLMSLPFIIPSLLPSPLIFITFQSLQDTVARFTSMDYALKDRSGSEDGSHIFEVILPLWFFFSFYLYMYVCEVNIYSGDCGCFVLF